MSDRLTVIYSARSAHDAYFLKNLLAEAQIPAVVSNSLLESNTGFLDVGWSIAARVVVSEDDAARAREIALEFDRTVSDRNVQGESAEVAAEPAAVPAIDWPTCPECDARRTTQCPICDTAGADFPPVDMGFEWIPESGDPLGGEPTCGAEASCGSCGCASEAAVPIAASEEPEAEDDEPAPTPPTLVMCPTCDEPFVPRHARLCEWCGHEFPDGYEVTLPAATSEQITDQLNTRVIAVIVGLLLLGTALAGYFLFLVDR